MKILLLSNYPTNFRVYDRNLRSKFHNELGKHCDFQKYFFIFKGQLSDSLKENNQIEMPYSWIGIIRKIAGVIFIIFNNFKLIKRVKSDLVMLEMANGLYDLPMFFYPIFFPNRKFYVETSTPAVNKSKIIRTLIDTMLAITLKPYKHVGCGNPSIVKKLRIPENKVCYSKIGYPEYTFSLKRFDKLNLVYLGTVNNRDIWKTVIGLKIFILKFPEIKITYNIIGGGNKKYVAELVKSIDENNMQNFVCYHGFQPVDFVNDIFTKCNIGIAFVPIVEYYDKVSTTKAVEYLLAGMPVIATKTTFATSLMKPEAGVLCEDTPEDFARALEEIYLNREKFNSEKIREMYKHYAMSYVIKNSYIPILKSLV